MLFEFEERDTDAEIMQAEMSAAWSDVVRTLYDSKASGGGSFGAPAAPEMAEDEEPGVEPGVEQVESNFESNSQEGLITRDEARSMLVQHGVIPSEWTEAEEATVVSDQGSRRLMASPEVQRSIEKWPGEDIVQYRWSPFGATEKVIHRSGT